MIRTYVGTASRLGLEFLALEDEASLDAVASQLAHGSLRPRVCFWVAVSDETAEKVGFEYRAGERIRAIRTLEVQAVEIGQLLSPWHGTRR